MMYSIKIRRNPKRVENMYNTITIILSIISIILTYKIYTFTLRFEKQKAKSQSDKILYLLNEDTSHLKLELNNIFMACVPATIIKNLTREGAEMTQTKDFLLTLNMNHEKIEETINQYQEIIKETKKTFAVELDIDDFNKINHLEYTTKKFLKGINDYREYFVRFDINHDPTSQNTDTKNFRINHIAEMEKGERIKIINDGKIDILHNSLTKILSDI